ncbi:MAG: hypothetical protein AABX14_00590 [Candidatus Aenigmatarchaeota archaeon]
MVTNTPNFSRALFKKNQQKMFLKIAKEKLNIKWTDFEKILEQETGYSPGSLRNWRAETCGMPLDAINFIVEKSGVQMPKNIEFREYKWGSKIGGRNVVRKYGKERMRLLGNKGRKTTERLYGKEIWASFASNGGKKAFSTKSGIFSPKNAGKSTYWRRIPFEKKIGIFDKKYDEKRIEWRFKGTILNNPKRNVQTRIGIKVRSKEEKRIIEKLSDWGFDVVYEPTHILIDRSTWIVPDFGFRDNKNIFIEHLGRSDDAYWNHKIHRWLKVLEKSDNKFIITCNDYEKTKECFSKYFNVIGIVKFGDWKKLNHILSQLYLIRKQQRCR